jgi:hypothetical protein
VAWKFCTGSNNSLILKSPIPCAILFINPLTQSIRIRTVFNLSLKPHNFVTFRRNRFLFFSLERGYSGLSFVQFTVRYSLLGQSNSCFNAGMSFTPEFSRRIAAKR